MKAKKFLNESARDLISLGSPIFFVLVLARILITENFAYLSQFIIAAAFLTLLSYYFKSNCRAGMGIILLIFVSMYYNNLAFAIFASIIYLLALASMIYLKENKIEVTKGFLFGLASAAAGYFISRIIFQ